MDHEAIIEDLISKIEEHAEENDAARVVEVKLKVGALVNIDTDDFREEFAEALVSTIADGARIDIVVSNDPDDPDAEEVILQSVQVE